ncbi:MAG: Fur family transcriptional regulator [Paracoccaceae bacterium]|jgi:Fur family ferric uptake transcriptional regulator|nr:MAG: transcriptional repressor [Alphaproteobacteria bacterium]|tara:strand:- start:1118 stop:1537 length:420 start_codon:yes stop_codon:yes gene_type:complete
MSLKTISERCRNAGIRMTGQRRLIIKVLENSKDHPDVETLFERSNKIDNKVSIATVYRTVKLLQNAGILEKLEFNDGRSRFEDAVRKHHDHLIDLDTGKVIEFIDEEIEHIQNKIANKLGYDLVGHKLELYGKKNDRKN